MLFSVNSLHSQIELQKWSIARYFSFWHHLWLSKCKCFMTVLITYARKLVSRFNHQDYEANDCTNSRKKERQMEQKKSKDWLEVEDMRLTHSDQALATEYDFGVCFIAATYTREVNPILEQEPKTGLIRTFELQRFGFMECARNRSNLCYPWKRGWPKYKTESDLLWVCQNASHRVFCCQMSIFSFRTRR